jgi:hypothetical protein
MLRIQCLTTGDTLTEGPAGALAGAEFFRVAGAAAKAKRRNVVESRTSTISV